MSMSRAALALSAVLLAPVCAHSQTSPTPPQSAAFTRQFQEAYTAYQAGNYPAATALLEHLQSGKTTNSDLHELLGLVYAAQSKDTKASEQLRTAVRLNPSSVPARNNLATSLVHLGKLADAEREWKEALRLDPEDYTANRSLAKAYLQSEQVAEALPLLEHAHRLRPEAADIGYDLALAYLQEGRVGDAHATAASLPPANGSGELHNLLGQIAEKEGKYLEAANEFATAAHVDPSENNLFVWAGELMQHRAYPAAIEVFEQGTKRYPTSPRQWVGLGMALYSRGDYEPSVRALLTAADLDARDPRCYLFLSKAYLSSPAQAEDVIERFRRYSALEPHNALAQYFYGASLWKGRRSTSGETDYKQVEALLQRSIALDSSNAEVHLQLGILYNDQHLYEKALPEYQRALELDPNSADAHFRLGRYYLRTGEKEKAQAELDLFQQLGLKHQAEVDRERAEVQQFVLAARAPSATQPGNDPHGPR